MSLTSKKNSRLEIRIDDNGLLLLRVQAEKCNLTVSAYVSMLIDTATRPLKDKILQGDMSYEDCKSFLDDKLQFRKLFNKQVK